MPKVAISVSPITGMLTIDGLVVDAEVLAMILTTPSRVLWRFQVVNGQVRATPFDERQVIWLDSNEITS